jgi:hypothetical protein
MEGDQEFDYLYQIATYVPGPGFTPDDQQLGSHRRAYESYSLPEGIQLTDQMSCAMDAVNMAVGQRLLTREGLELSEGSGVILDHHNVVAALRTAGFIAAPTWTNPQIAPSLGQVLKQKSGVWIVQFNWDNKGVSVRHTVAVNCYLRLVFCNTLGALPFALAEKHGSFLRAETAATHDRVTARLGVKMVTRVWHLLRSTE